MKAASSAVLIHLFHSVPDVSILRDSRARSPVRTVILSRDVAYVARDARSTQGD